MYAATHLHSMYSLDAIGAPEEWVLAAKQKGLAGIAITDHGNCSSMLELYKMGQKHEFPVIMGTEIYLVESLEKNKENKYNHLILLAKNETGYRNLCRLSTLSYDEDHFYYKPRLTLDDVLSRKEGLIVTSACIVGPISARLVKNQNKEAVELAQRLKEAMGDDFYLEILPIVLNDEKYGGAEIQSVANKGILKISKDLDIKVIATPDAHIPNKEDKLLQDIKMDNQSKGWRFDIAYFLPTEAEFKDEFNVNHPYIDNETLDQCLKNTLEIVEKTKDLKLNFNPLLPKVYDGDSKSVLYEKIKAHSRLPHDIEYAKRLMYEIKVVADNGTIDLTNYFLLLEDVCDWCRKNDVQVGPGRGSAGGSLLAYVLGITSIDPIKYGLLFNRFLNETRIQKGTLPDIDLDFSNRDVVVEYLKNKYGIDRVCKLGTVSGIKIKSAIKDTMRALMGENFDYAQACTVTKNLPPDIDSMPEDQAKQILYQEMSNNQTFGDLAKKYDLLPVLFKMVGQARQMGVHASAVAITPITISDIIPLGRRDNEWYTQYSAKWCEMAGVIKFDILTVNTLNYIHDCLALVKERKNINLEMEQIPIDDSETFESFRRGDTDFVFQFNSDISKNILTQVPVNSIQDLSNITAIGRPGTIDSGMDKEWVARRRGDKPSTPFHPELDGVLKDTCGLIVYQESLMNAFRVLANFSESEADDIRRATGKKDAKLMQSYKQTFIDRVGTKGINVDEAIKIWEHLETFSGYSFNASHSFAYATIGYYCAFLKTHHPLEWWCAVANSIVNSKMSNKKDKLKEMYKSASDYFVLPNINDSTNNFYISGDKIICPFSVLNGIGDTAIESIIKSRNLGKFNTFEDFLMKSQGSGLRKDAILSLIWSNCFSLIDNNSGKDLAKMFCSICFSKSKSKSDREKFTKLLRQIEQMNQIDVARETSAALSISTGNIRDVLKDVVPPSTIFDYSVLNTYPSKKDVKLVGEITNIKPILTKRSEEMCFVDIDHDGSKYSLTLWPEIYMIYRNDLALNKYFLIDGYMNIFNNKRSIVVESLKCLE